MCCYSVHHFFRHGHQRGLTTNERRERPEGPDRQAPPTTRIDRKDKTQEIGLFRGHTSAQTKRLFDNYLFAKTVHSQFVALFFINGKTGNTRELINIIIGIINLGGIPPLIEDMMASNYSELQQTTATKKSQASHGWWGVVLSGPSTPTTSAKIYQGLSIAAWKTRLCHNTTWLPCYTCITSMSTCSSQGEKMSKKIWNMPKNKKGVK
jgi:hypothetical protein